MLMIAVGCLAFGCYTFSGCCKKNAARRKEEAVQNNTTKAAPSITKPTTFGSQECLKTDPDLKSKKHIYKKEIIKQGGADAKPKDANVSGQTVYKSTFGLPDARAPSVNMQAPSVNVPSMDKDLNNTYNPSKTCDPSRITHEDAPKKSVDKKSLRSVTALPTEGVAASTHVTLDPVKICDGNSSKTQKNTDTLTPTKEKKKKDNLSLSTQSTAQSADKTGAKKPCNSEPAGKLEEKKKEEEKKTIGKPDLKESEKVLPTDKTQARESKEDNHEVSKYV